MLPLENITPVALPPLALPPTATPPAAERKPAPPATLTVRVLHVINGEHYAGAERVQDLLAKRLPEFGYSAGFAALKPGRFRAMRQVREVPLFDVPMLSRLDLRAARRVAWLVREGDYRIIHAHTVRSLLIGRAASVLTGVPLIYHAHSPASRDSANRWRNRLGGAVERMCLRGVARVIAVSRAMAEHVAHEGFDAAKIKVVYNGVPRFDALPPRRTPRGTWTLGIAALFRPRKGLEVLLQAMSRLHGEGYSVRLRAVGGFESPGYKREILTLLERLGLVGLVAWTGFARDVTAELRRMDLMVLPSLFGEGLPMVVLEAMAAGVPVAASRVPGVPEAIRHGRDGVLAEPADPDALAEAIAAVIDGRHDWSAMRASAFLRQATMFSDRSMAEGTAAVYNDVLVEVGRKTQGQ